MSGNGARTAEIGSNARRYQERFSATGRTSGSYNKRDGRANDGEILTCRLIDRPLRPTVPDGYTADVQLLAWVLSYDGAHDPQVLAVQACAAALRMSSVPTLEAVGAARCVVRSPRGRFSDKSRRRRGCEVG